MFRFFTLLAHPGLDKSHANAALSRAMARLPGMDTLDLYGQGGTIDVAAHTQRLLAADALVLQFPMQWYSTPALLKQWQDEVLTRMVYVSPDTEGRHLAGKPMLAVVTAGAAEADYTPQGRNLFAVADLLRPLQATAHRCGLRWQPPFVLYEASTADASRLEAAGERLLERLSMLARDPGALALAA